MSKKHGARQQKHLAKQKAKRDAKRTQIARRDSPDPNIRLRSADRWPIVASLVPASLWQLGLGNLIIARKMPDGQLACAVFLVDTFCLGVKNALWKIMTQGEFDFACQKLQTERLAPVAPGYFAKLIYRAADFGQSCGFPPHRDFRHAQKLLAGIDPSQCLDEFEFGRDGRPLYIRGPSETIDEARVIAARVQSQGGDFMLKASDAPTRQAHPPDAPDFGRD
jgi:hypothetical protein